MVTWREFEQSAPEIADGGRKMLYQFGPGLAFLATVRKDGAPRLHPICPTIVGGALYAFILHKSPKCSDLRRFAQWRPVICLELPVIPTRVARAARHHRENGLERRTLRLRCAFDECAGYGPSRGIA